MSAVAKPSVGACLARALGAGSYRNLKRLFLRMAFLEDDVMRETANRPQRKVRLGIVGGGPGSNIGETHRYAARLDDRYALVTGVFASDAERSRDFAATLDIAPERRYGSWQEMAEQEAKLKDGLEVVSIMTPNNSHYAIARAFLEYGIDVICDKPLT